MSSLGRLFPFLRQLEPWFSQSTTAANRPYQENPFELSLVAEARAGIAKSSRSGLGDARQILRHSRANFPSYVRQLTGCAAAAGSALFTYLLDAASRHWKLRVENNFAGRQGQPSEGAPMHRSINPYGESWSLSR